MILVLASHIGNIRENHEDNAIVYKNYLRPEQIANMSVKRSACFAETQVDIRQMNTLVAVCDGMGGHSSGEVASCMTVKHLADNHDRIVRGDRSLVVKEISNISRMVFEAGRKNPSCFGMGAALCGLILKEGKFIVFNAGDSRMYKFSNGVLLQLTKDHTEGERLRELGLLSDEEIKTFPKRKALYKYVGAEGELISDVFELDAVSSGDLFLLCTDGLCDVLSDEEIASVLALDETLKAKAEKFLSIALSRRIGQGDNITLILLEV